MLGHAPPAQDVRFIQDQVHRPIRYLGRILPILYRFLHAPAEQVQAGQVAKTLNPERPHKLVRVPAALGHLHDVNLHAHIPGKHFFNHLDGTFRAVPACLVRIQAEDHVLYGRIVAQKQVQHFPGKGRRADGHHVAQPVGIQSRTVGLALHHVKRRHDFLGQIEIEQDGTLAEDAVLDPGFAALVIAGRENKQFFFGHWAERGNAGLLV